MKIKQISLSIALVALTLIIKAQDKYEYLVIEFNITLKNEIHISIDGKEYIQEKADFGSTEKSHINATPLLKKVSEYQDKGWELMNLNTIYTSNHVYFAYMKKKKVDKK